MDHLGWARWLGRPPGVVVMSLPVIWFVIDDNMANVAEALARQQTQLRELRGATLSAAEHTQVTFRVQANCGGGQPDLTGGDKRVATAAAIDDGLERQAWWDHEDPCVARMHRSPFPAPPACRCWDVRSIADIRRADSVNTARSEQRDPAVRFIWGAESEGVAR